MRFTTLSVAAFAVSVAFAGSAGAVIAPFGGTATGTDPLGQSWVASNSGGSAWGEPGLGLGELSFNTGGFVGTGTGTSATEFDFIFLKGVTGSIDQTPAVSPFGFETTTRFSDTTKGELWTATFVGPNEVDFKAPSGHTIDMNDQFFVNVAFTGPVDTTHFSFAGLWTDRPGVPEPATWALMLGGFGLAGVALRRRRTAVAA